VTPKTLGPLPSSATWDDESHGSLTPSDRFHRRRPVAGSATTGVWWAVERPALDARAHDRSVFWAIVGGIGASLLLPAMQSLIHGNVDGATRRKVYALVGAAVAIARRSGRCWAGSSPRFLAAGLRARGCHHRRGPVRDPLVRDVPYEGDRGVDAVGVLLSVAGMGGVVLGVLV
jgi:hypothetical protein